MCTTGYNHFTCGCAWPAADTLQFCEYAKLKGIVCPDFQIDEDCARSRSWRFLVCLEHA
ncbi:hypothetical protein B0J18DRAFT_438184 [Chaetomium sp. MPI-SDFR-AT-0129]|uniref:Uncharacterized protein n=1 Tax=Dichotomopilus funicola TaxID=1934379 RepID=A0AAN6V0M9_9PEZI|nr:hypothetical protein B0J18DRAFT_438184 [Chaetomium sp. MPI-SDFR-AT-0129]KAK4141361.1 hypothetical protein C8A04DRAFT_31112 [Dichotomopilus funicola]